MTYLARLHALKAEKCPTLELTKPTKPQSDASKGGFGSFGSASTRPVSGICAAPVDPTTWPDALAAIDASRPPAGFDPDRWRYLLTDARWLCRNHGQAAAALGWTASDLFGIDPLSGWGGLADRLEGARNLVLTDRIAHWRGADLEGWLWRCTLTAKPVLWEA